MAAEKANLEGSKVGGLDIFKNVAVSLTIAFLVYWLPVLAEQFFSPIEIRYRYTRIGEHSGYLFSIQNYSRRPVDDISIFIDSPKGIGPIYNDGAISIEASGATRPSLIKLKTITPRSEAILFVTTDGPLDGTLMRASSSSLITSFESTQTIERSLWSPSTFFNSAFTALLYLAFALTMTSQQKQLRTEVKSLRIEVDQAKESAEKGIDDIKWRFGRLRVYMQRRILRLEDEVQVWRRFFKLIYSSVFTSKGDADKALEIIMKSSGIHMVKRLRDYSEVEFQEILEESERSKNSRRSLDGA